MGYRSIVIAAAELIGKQNADVEDPCRRRHIALRKLFRYGVVQNEYAKDFERRRPMQCKQKYDGKADIESRPLILPRIHDLCLFEGPARACARIARANRAHQVVHFPAEGM